LVDTATGACAERGLETILSSRVGMPDIRYSMY